MNDQKRGGPDPYSKPDQSGSKSLIIVGVVVLVVVLAVVAVLMTGGGDSSVNAKSDKNTGAYAAANAVKEQSGVTVTGEALPPFPEVDTPLAPADQDSAVGKVAPTLSGQTFDGKDMTIDPKDGRAKVVVFAAHWCPHCQVEIPKIQEWINDGNKPDDVDFYAVSTAVQADRPNYPPSKWIAKVGWTPPVLLDDADSHAAVAYGLTEFPFMVALNADGTVSERGSGEIPMDQFGAMVDALQR
ncbi:MAG TPA: TlpA disulfide reductase family protein [Microthrixaceae bacterium]|nr:TlpA disulfide reductase family protein [Microthrixaceae bacterium]